MRLQRNFQTRWHKRRFFRFWHFYYRSPQNIIRHWRSIYNRFPCTGSLPYCSDFIWKTHRQSRPKTCWNSFLRNDDRHRFLQIFKRNFCKCPQSNYKTYRSRRKSKKNLRRNDKRKIFRFTKTPCASFKSCRKILKRKINHHTWKNGRNKKICPGRKRQRQFISGTSFYRKCRSRRFHPRRYRIHMYGRFQIKRWCRCKQNRCKIRWRRS